MDDLSKIRSETLALGVHFGLPEEDYLQDPGLGSTQLKQLLISPLHYWWHSPFGPDHVEASESSAMALGTAIHKYTLEGREAFEAAYTIAPQKEDYDELLVTASDLKAWLKEQDQKVSGAKDELIERVFSTDPDAQVWDAILEEHDEFCKINGKTGISEGAAQDIRIRGEIIRSTPGVSDLLSGGHPEVSIFWESKGVRFKARIDYLSTTAQTDVKSFTNPNGDSIRKMIGRKVAGHQWHLQARLHWNGVQAAKAMLLEGGADYVFGDAPGKEWLIDFAKSPAGEFWWLFVQSSGAPIIKAMTCPRTRKKDHSDIWQDAQFKIDHAIRLYADHAERFGMDEAWIDTEPPCRLHDEDFPPWTIGD